MRADIGSAGRCNTPRRQYVQANGSCGQKPGGSLVPGWTNGRINPVPDLDRSGAEVMSGGEGVTVQPLSCVVRAGAYWTKMDNHVSCPLPWGSGVTVVVKPSGECKGSTHKSRDRVLARSPRRQ